MSLRTLALLAAYVGSVLIANLVTSRFGLIPAGFGLLVPAGTYTAALALSLRDTLHEFAGVRWVWVGIAVGTAISALTGDGRIALASGAAFVVSELLDLAVYSRLREQGWRRALLLSNAAGSIVDTVLFLALSGLGLSLSAVAGQVLVKAVWVTLTFLLIVEVVRRVVPRQRQFSEGS